MDKSISTLRCMVCGQFAYIAKRTISTCWKIPALILLLGLSPGCTTISLSDNSDEFAESSLLAQIRKGGYVIFFRHAATDHASQDTDISQCETQRNLDGKGRTQARIIGEQIADMKIPIGDVKTSRLCRALDTGRLAFQRATPVDELTSIVGVSPDVRIHRAKAISQMLSSMPLAGKNTVLVSHKHMFHDAAKVWLQEGEAAIYKPDGRGGTALVTRVMPTEWSTILKQPISAAMPESGLNSARESGENP